MAHLGQQLSRCAARKLIGWLGTLAMSACLVIVGLIALEATGPARAAQGDASAGQELFAANCATCHGASAQGGATVPALVGVVDRLGREEVEATIRAGRGGMPRFGERLTDEEITNVIAYLGTLPAGAAQPDPPRRGWMMDRDHMMGDGMMGGMGWLGALLWLLFSVAVLVLVVLVVLAVVWLARGLGPSRSKPRADGSADGGPPSGAREVLDLRYARGEVSREEYLQARRDLEGPG